MSEITTTARRIARSVNKAPSYRALAFDGDGRLVEVWQAGQTRQIAATLERIAALLDQSAAPKHALLTIEEAAEILRTPVSTLYQWRHEGKGPPSMKPGARVLYKRTALDAWIDEHEDGAQ